MANSQTQKNHHCQLLNAKEVVRLLATSVRSAPRYRASGHLPQPVKISGSILGRLSDSRLFIEWDCDMAQLRVRKEAQNARK